MSNINTGIYVRVSTEEQALNGFSIRAQKEKLIYYSTEIKNWNVYKVYSDEGISGKDIVNRPSMKEMLEDIKNKIINNVLVFKIDRLTRSTKDLIELVEFFNKYECDFNSLNESIDTSTATGRMFIKIIGIFAEFERENIVERVKLGFERKAKEGHSICSSTPPFGYDRPIGSKKLIINKNEAKIVKQIFKMFIENNTISSIVDYLNKKRIKTKKGKAWTYKTIKLILTNTTYIGKVRYGINKKYYFERDGNHVHLIDIEDFEEVRKKLIRRNVRDDYFSHILKCRCGEDMISKRVYKMCKTGDKKMYINYRCKAKKNGCSKDISHLKVDKLFCDKYDIWKKYSINKKNSILNENNIEFIIEDNTIIINKDLSNV